MRENIPNELRVLKQWVCSGPDKLPINARTGQPASVTDPFSWSSFESASGTGYPHIGFVLTERDPYCIIDLDSPTDETQQARHTKVFEAFPTYAELSQSGSGVHIVCRGKVPHGVRRDRIEIYSDARYMIFTGNVLKPLPIVDCQELLDTMYAEMASTKHSTYTDQNDKHTDDEIMAMAWDAVNADKFRALWEGDWQSLYPSQSEADLSLLSMLAFYSKSNGQCKRLFLASALGERKKAGRKGYLDDTLAIIRSNEPPDVDLTQLRHDTPARVLPPPPPKARMANSADGGSDGFHRTVSPAYGDDPIAFPPGYVGLLAAHFHATALRPVRDIALAAAITFTSGVVGRSYNISGSGLNQYLILLAKTGSGKEGAASGIDSLIASVRPRVPMCDTFIGPAAFASGQALIRVLDDRPCFVSVLGEFGITLQQLCDPRAPAALSMLKKVLLDLYAKSGFNKILRPSVYSDTEKNTKLIQAPNVTILGESTPEEFYGGLDHAHIMAGLIPRFSVIEYTGPRPALNHKAFGPPSDQLIEQTVNLLTIALTTRQNTTCAPVQLDNEATELMNDYELLTTAIINKSPAEMERNLWNRAHLKALKLSALIAVGVNPEQPIVDKACAIWALEFVDREVNLMISRFSSGDIGQGESKQEVDIRKCIDLYLKMTPKARLQYRIPQKLADQQLIPLIYIRRYLMQRASFKNDRRGGNLAIKMLLDTMVDEESLQILSPSQGRELFDSKSPIYALGQHY